LRLGFLLVRLMMSSRDLSRRVECFLEWNNGFSLRVERFEWTDFFLERETREGSLK